VELARNEPISPELVLVCPELREALAHEFLERFESVEAALEARADAASSRRRRAVSARPGGAGSAARPAWSSDHALLVAASAYGIQRLFAVGLISVAIITLTALIAIIAQMIIW
jgi:hypothetical protein